MTTSDWIALASGGIAIVALLYTWSSNTKKYELTEQYRNRLLEWYENTTIILIRLRLMSENSCLDKNNKCELLSTLSSQIEVGRFFFPNINKRDYYGDKKPSAYQGYRHIILEFLVYSYDLYKRDDSIKYLSHAEELQRHFTSCIFELLQPAKFNKSIRKYTGVVFRNNVTLDEFLEKDPKGYIFYS